MDALEFLKARLRMCSRQLTCEGFPAEGINCGYDADATDAEYEKLIQIAAYEDTGLSPEEVLSKDKADEIALKLMRLADLESLCSYTCLREMAEANKDGRLVVLPCKVGNFKR